MSFAISHFPFLECSFSQCNSISTNGEPARFKWQMRNDKRHMAHDLSFHPLRQRPPFIENIHALSDAVVDPICV